ncbi:MAG: murein biosynthesis integral membrane protein MurJ [Pseudomonadales bacterium]
MSTEPRETPVSGQNVARQGGVVAAMTLISRVAGVARDIALAGVLGASGLADAFLVAFRIPNFFRRLFAEGAFNQAFVPVLMRYREQGALELTRFVGVMGGNLAVVLGIVVVLGVLFAPAVTMVFAPGFVGTGRFELTASLLRITFPYLGFISLASFAGAVLNAHHRYAAAAFTPVLLNLCLLLAVAVSLLTGGSAVVTLAWGVLVAGLVQLLFLLAPLRGIGMLLPPAPNLAHPGARQVGRLLIPAVLAASVSQINALIDSVLASTLMVGSVSWLYYADRLLELPIGMVAVALATVLLPNLSRLDARGETQKFQQTLDWGLGLALALAIPAAVALGMLAEPLIATIFQRGRMQILDVRMTAAALQLFAVGLTPMVLVKVLAPAYFAREDTRTPFRIGIASVATNIVISLLVFRWFGHVGLALAMSAAACVNAGLLLRGLVRSGAYVPGSTLVRMLGRVVPATLAMAVVLWVVTPAAEAWLTAGGLWRAGWLLIVVVAGGGAYSLCLWLLGLRPADFLHRL